jgi:hypothetical protein
MKSEVFQKLSSSNLPIRIVGDGEVTHAVVGKMIAADGKESEVICLIAEKPRPASAEFQKILKSVSCQCGKQKIENFPLCGCCFSNLRTGIKQSLLRNRHAQLENAYHWAVRTLTEGRKSERR